jgi:hypothetical protein
MTTPLLHSHARALLDTWDRIGIGVRCAYNPDCPSAVRAYLEAGRRVAADGLRSQIHIHRRTLNVLLQTARDEALPRYWRSVCLEHTTYPLARLQSLLKESDPIALEAMHCAVRAAHDVIAASVAYAGSQP